MSKFLDQKFLSHGTQLGSLGPVSQKVRDEIFPILQIPFKNGPYDFPTPLDPFPSGKNLADFPTWCGGAFGVAPSEPLIFMAKLRLTIKTIFSALFTHSRVYCKVGENGFCSHIIHTDRKVL